VLDVKSIILTMSGKPIYDLIYSPDGINVYGATGVGSSNLFE